MNVLINSVCCVTEWTICTATPSFESRTAMLAGNVSYHIVSLVERTKNVRGRTCCKFDRIPYINLLATDFFFILAHLYLKCE